MALVCDFKSEPEPSLPQHEEAAAPAVNEDLEDGEIEDDDEEETPPSEQPETPPAPEQTQPPPTPPQTPANTKLPNDKFPHNNRGRFDKADRHNRFEERKRNHLTEAEKSVMHLHKLERFEREKRDRFKRDQTSTVDDFASNIEKAIANVLKKEKKRSDDEKEEEDGKRGKKRKKKDKDKKKSKQRKILPKEDDVVQDETETTINTHGGSLPHTRTPSPHSDYNSYDSSTSSDHSKKDKKKKNSRTKNKDGARNDKKYNKDKSREQKTDLHLQMKDSQGVCLFFLQGKCNKDTECPFSHEIPQPLKLELCKFYLMGCCAKGEKCFYMHSEFPCKFYHTGLPCYAGDTCKFAHGKPLEEGLRQILFKHIETAPKEILGEFPRLSRDGALTMINQAQKALEVKYGVEKNTDSSVDKTSIPSLFELNIPVPAELMQKDDGKKEKNDKRERNRPSRWQDADPVDNSSEQKQQIHLTFGIKGFYSERGDQDMRINSNGDVDMRTLPPQLNTQSVTTSSVTTSQDVDIRTTQDTDIRHLSVDSQVDFSKDIDIRQIPQFTNINDDNDNTTDEPNLEIVEDDNVDEKIDTTLPTNLPKKQQELFMRIRAQQKQNTPETPKETSDEDTNNIDWYSDDDDDDDDNRLTIRDDTEEPKPKIEEPTESVIILPPPIKPVEVMEKLGDLSKIDISAEVTKMLLTSISQSGLLNKSTTPSALSPKDLRPSDAAPPKIPVADPRRSRVSSTETKKVEKVSIYDQGCILLEDSKDVDLRSLEKDMDLRPKFDTDLRATSTIGRTDIDLRQMGLPFKAMQNYTPASEISASINSHAPITWRVHLIDIPRPDYTGLKLSPHEAQNTGDPRLRKIFRMSSVDEKDSPASPKESPKVGGTVRIDPRRRKLEEKLHTMETNSMTYTQQLNILQASAFYQSLTSNQKVLLNQELASKYDHSGSNDPTLNGILSNLGLLSNTSTVTPSANTTANSSALSILANINSLIQQPSNLILPQNQTFVNQIAQNPNVVNQIAQSIIQPGLLGAAPVVTNHASEFQLNFDPRQGGLLGNAPNYNNYNENTNYNFNDNYYEEGNNFMEASNSGGGGGGGRGRGNRGGFRDRQHRRGRNFNNRNSRNFRNRNRNNRSRTPP